MSYRSRFRASAMRPAAARRRAVGRPGSIFRTQRATELVVHAELNRVDVRHGVIPAEWSSRLGNFQCAGPERFMRVEVQVFSLDRPISAPCKFEARAQRPTGRVLAA